jgi:hypothetical protein
MNGNLMTRFFAIKIHYDHRSSLPKHLKYSRAPTHDEYNDYLALYNDEDVGGEGFHECLNFNIKEEENTRIYLPPGYIPGPEKCDDEYIIFTFTYKTDKELSSHIIGIHAGVVITNREGIRRTEIQAIDGIESLSYHAESQPNLTTLLSSPIKYDFKEGKYTPIFKSWGNGLRYLTDDNAINIIDEALKKARNLSTKEKTLRFSVDREIQVLNSIRSRYFGEGKNNDVAKRKATGGSGSPPDKETGYLGEKYVYEKELEYVRGEGLDISVVEWISQAIPSSVFDIKTVRKFEDGYRAHYLEVKSTRMTDYNNVYISGNQIDFFLENPNDSTFVFVNLDKNKKAIKSEEYTLEMLKNKFALKPIKYRVVEK